MAPPRAPLRCHLLIGPPASGKTTLAKALAPLLSGPGEPPAVVLSTDAIRAEVFGDAAVQGPWGDIQQRLHQRIRRRWRPAPGDRGCHPCPPGLAAGDHPGPVAAGAGGVDRLVAPHRPCPPPWSGTPAVNARCRCR